MKQVSENADVGFAWLDFAEPCSRKRHVTALYETETFEEDADYLLSSPRVRVSYKSLNPVDFSSLQPVPQTNLPEPRDNAPPAREEKLYDAVRRYENNPVPNLPIEIRHSGLHNRRLSGKGASGAHGREEERPALTLAFGCGEEERSRIETGAVEAVTSADSAASTASG